MHALVVRIKVKPDLVTVVLLQDFKHNVCTVATCNFVKDDDARSRQSILDSKHLIVGDYKEGHATITASQRGAKILRKWIYFNFV